jgi:signal peptidase
MDKQKAKKIVKGIGHGLGIALIIFEVLIIIFLVVSKVQGDPPTLFGHQMYFIRTGSMSPYLEPGDVIISKKYDGGELVAGKDGSVVTYYGNIGDNVDMITHRVIKIDAENQRFYTKGDANEIADGDPVHFKNVLGVPQFAIPKLGYVSNFVQNPPGTYITIGVGLLLIILVFLPDLFGKKKKDQPEEAAQPVASSAEEENKKLREELEKLRQEISGKKDE